MQRLWQVGTQEAIARNRASPGLSGHKKPQPVKGWGLGIGGDRRDRTADLLIANQTLYQLSYAPQGSAIIPVGSIL